MARGGYEGGEIRGGHSMGHEAERLDANGARRAFAAPGMAGRSVPILATAWDRDGD